MALPRPVRRPRRARQRGFSLLEAALLVLLVGSAVTVGFLLLRAREPVRQVQAQEQALRWADEALVAYAARNARLPCPVTTPSSGTDDCVGAGEKGWLPTRALESAHPGGTGAVPPLRYMVYRGDGAASDLALAQDRFSPHKWDRTPHDFDAVNGLDLCAALASAATQLGSTGVRGDRARTSDIDGNPVNVAYGLGAPGATPGTGGRFDASNQQAAALMESPARGASGDYDDRVRVRDFDSLAQSLGCRYADAAEPDGLVLASLDTLALAVDVSDEVDAQNASLKEETESAVKMAAVSEVFAVLNVALAAASIANSVSTLATGSAQLATAVATCPVPPFVSCGLIPPYTSAVTAASVAIGFASASTALAAAALVASSTGLAKTVEARDMAKAADRVPPADIAGLADKACLAAEGGMLYERADENGNLVPVPAGYWQDGLKQEVEQLEQELEQTRVDLDATRDRLAWLGEIPSHLIAYPPRPERETVCTGSGDEQVCVPESDASYNQRIEEWLATRKHMEDQLQPKLEAIRRAEDAYFAWETAVELENQAQTEYDQMLEAVGQLQEEVAQCQASPPSELVAMRQCANSSVALQGMTTCSLDILTQDQVERRQCVAWKHEDLQTAAQNEAHARGTYQDRFWTAWNLPQPPIAEYLDDGGIPGSIWYCTVLWSCDALIIPGQHDNEDDHRETYAMTYYKLLGLEVALEEQTAELEAKREAYAEAQAQCDALRALQDAGAGGGAQVPVVGAGNILRQADCKGATGPVEPQQCNGTPAGATP